MSVKVTACLNPFSTEKTEFSFDGKISINEIIRKIDTLHASNLGWRCLIEDEIVTDFSRIVDDGAHVYLKTVPQGDKYKYEGTTYQKAGIGMKVGGGVLAVLGIVLLCTGVGAGWGLALITGGVSVYASGYVMYTMPDVTATANTKDREKPEQDPSVRDGRNQMRPYGIVPTLLGKRRIYADLAAKPYTLVVDGKQYFYQLFCVAQKDIEIDTSSFKIDETPLTELSETKDIAKIMSGQDSAIRLYVSYGSNTTPIMHKCVHEIQLNKVLKHELDDGQDGAIIQTTPDDTDEIDLDIFFYNGLGKYDDDGTVISTSVEVCAWYKRADADDSAYQLLGYFGAGNTNELSGDKLKTKRYKVRRENLEPASYTVKVARITADSTDTKIVDEVYVGSIRALKNEQPVSAERCRQLTLIGLRILATEKTNGIVEQLNFVAQSKLPSYSNGEWSYALSSNPAAAAMYAMQGGLAQQKLALSEIEVDSFQDLYEWCEEEAHPYECNAYITESMTISQLLSAIGSTCRTEILRMNGKICAIQDIARDSFVQLFTPRNSSEYKETILLPEIPDEMKLGFVDRASGFAENEVSVYNTSTGAKSGTETTSQSVSLWGVTDKKQAMRIGMFNYAVSRARAVVYTFTADFEYLMCRKGDWIKYAGDLALAGICQGRIAEIVTDENSRIVGFYTDEDCPMEHGKSYGIRLRKSSGECAILYVENTELTGRQLLLRTSIAASSDIEEGNLFTFGEVRNNRLEDALDLIITDIQCTDNLSAEITCVDYSPEIFNVDRDGFVLPEFKNNLSKVRAVVDSGAVSRWKTWTTYNDSDEEPATPTGDGTENGWHYFQTGFSKWISTKTAANVEDGTWSTPSPMGQIAVDVIKELTGTDTVQVGSPDRPTVTVATADKDGINFSFGTFGRGLSNQIKKISIFVSKNQGEWQLLTETDTLSATYRFDRSTDGYPERSVLSTWNFRAKATNAYGLESVYSQVFTADTTSYGTWIIPAPTVNMTIFQDHIEYSVSDIPSGIYGNIATALKVGNRVLSTARKGMYFFDRSVDGYPEQAALLAMNWQVSQTSEAYSRTDSVPGANITFSDYKTWIIPALSAKMTAYRDYLYIEWQKTAECAGSVKYAVSVDGVTVKSDMAQSNLTYYFDRSVDGYPEKRANVTGNEKALEDYVVVITATGEASTRTATVNAANIDTSNYKTWHITNPSVTAVASEGKIEIDAVQGGDFYGAMTYDCRVNGTSISGSGKATSWTYGLTGYPSAAQVAANSITVECSNGAYSTTVSVQSIDTSGYRGYTPAVPSVSYTTSGRVITLKWDSQDIFQFRGAKIQVAKAYKIVGGAYTPITDESELVWYAPAVAVNPYASLENYKTGNEGGYLTVDGNTISFTLPLYGQDTDESEETLYAYRVAARSVSEASAYAAVLYLAVKPASAKDVVKAWKLNDQGEKVRIPGALGANQIYVEELSAITANMGLITDGGFMMQASERALNYWAIGDVLDEHGNIELYKGEFRVGDENQYIKVSRKRDEHGNVLPGFDISFVVETFEVSSTGTSINSGTFEVADSNGNTLFKVEKDADSWTRVSTGQAKSARAITESLNENFYYSGSVSFAYCTVGGTFYMMYYTESEDNRYDLRLLKRTETETTRELVEAGLYMSSSPQVASGNGCFWWASRTDSSSSEWTLKKYDCSTGEVSSGGTTDSYPNRIALLWHDIYEDSSSHTLRVKDLRTGTVYENDTVIGDTNKIVCITDDGGKIYIVIRSDYFGVRTVVTRFDPATHSFSSSWAMFGIETDLDVGIDMCRISVNGSILHYTGPAAWYADGSTAIEGSAVIRAELDFGSQIGVPVDVWECDDMFNYVVMGVLTDTDSTESSSGIVADVGNIEDNSWAFELDAPIYRAVCVDGTAEVHELYTKRGTVALSRISGTGIKYVSASDDTNKAVYLAAGKIPSGGNTLNFLTGIAYSILGGAYVHNLSVDAHFYDTQEYIDLGHQLYRSGFGVCKVLYDYAGRRYRYVFDTGAYLEFDEDGNPVGTDGKQGDKGDRGDKGDKGDAFTYEDFTQEQLAALKGEKGDKGDTGAQGPQGEQGIQGIQGIAGQDGFSVRTTSASCTSATTSVPLSSIEGYATRAVQVNDMIVAPVSGNMLFFKVTALDGTNATVAYMSDYSLIDDGTVQADKTWSSSKINSELATKTSYPKGYVYIQLNGKKSPAQMNMQPETGCSWVDITADYASFPYIKIGSGTTQSGHNAYHRHTMSHTHGMQNHTHGHSHIAYTGCYSSNNEATGYGLGGLPGFQNRVMVSAPSNVGTSWDATGPSNNTTEAASNSNTSYDGNSSQQTVEVNATYAVVWEVQ